MALKTYQRTETIQQGGVVPASGLRAEAESWAEVGKTASVMQNIAYREGGQYAQEQGKQEGEKAVWTDPATGKPQIVGTLPEGSRPYAEAYRKAAEARYQAELGVSSLAKLGEISNANATNPEGFRHSWQGYIDGVTESVPDTIRPGAELLLKEMGAKQYYKLQTEDFARTKDEAKVSTLNLVDALERNTVDTLRGSGLAGGTPQFMQEKTNIVQSLLNDQVHAGILTPEEGNARLKDFKFRLVRGTISGEAIKMAKEGNAKNVDKFLDDFRRSPSDQVDDYQRDQIASFAKGEVATELAKAKTQQSAELEAAKKSLKEDFIGVSWKGQNPAMDDATALRLAVSTQDPALVSDVKAAITARTVTKQFSLLSPQDQAAALAASQPKNYGLRPDGTPKGSGYLGEIKLSNGGVATEYSVGVEINGKEMDIPTLVPTLTKDEIEQVKTAAVNGTMPPPNVIEKASAYAQQRLAEGKSVFADQGGDTADTLKLRENLQAIYSETQSAMATGDTLEIAQRRGLITADPIDFANPLSMQKRAADVAKADQQFGVNTNPLLPAEKDQLIKVFDGAVSSEDKIGIYNTMKQNMGYDYTLRAMRQLGQKRPAMALAMAMSDDAPETARQILMGDLTLQADKQVLGKADFYPNTFRDHVGTAVQGDDVLRNAIYEASLAVYADAAKRNPSITNKVEAQQSEEFQKAIDTVTGGIATYNGFKTIVPKRGMTDDDFGTLIDGMNDNNFRQAAGGKKLVALDGKEVSADVIHSKGTFDWVGDGQYILKLNIGGSLTGQTVFLADDKGLIKDKWGRPVPAELDLKPFVGGK